MSPSDVGNLILQALYYILVAIILFLSIFSVYIAIRYGRSRLFTLVLSLVYIFFFLIALNQSHTALQSLLS